MSKLRFRSIIEINGINPYVLVSAGRATRIRKEWRKPMPVRIRVNGGPDAPWRINLMPVGDGSFYLYLHGNVRKASQTKVGDTVAVASIARFRERTRWFEPLADALKSGRADANAV